MSFLSVAPSAPGNFRVTAFDSTTLTVAWNIPDPINGQLGAYELRYTNEVTSAVITRLIFIRQFRIFGLQARVTYRVEVRASTISLLGDTLWGPYAALRVRDGVVIEVPTNAPPTTAMTTTQANIITTRLQPTGQVDVATTEVPMTTIEEVDMSTFPKQTTPPVVTTPSVVLNPPSVVPSQILLRIPTASLGEVEVIWRVSNIEITFQVTGAYPPPHTHKHSCLISW